MRGCVSGRRRRKRYFVGQKADLKVGLEDCHSDIKGGDFVRKALWKATLSDDCDTTNRRL